jgi:hypothetical protein
MNVAKVAIAIPKPTLALSALVSEALEEKLANERLAEVLAEMDVVAGKARRRLEAQTTLRIVDGAPMSRQTERPMGADLMIRPECPVEASLGGGPAGTTELLRLKKVKSRAIATLAMVRESGDTRDPEEVSLGSGLQRPGG